MNSERFSQQKLGRENGFTFVELLAVIAIVALLAVTLLPALANTQGDTRACQCLNNQKQIIAAWRMYADDNLDLLPPNDYPYTTSFFLTSAAGRNNMKNWVVGTMEQPSDAEMDSEMTNQDTLLSAYIRTPATYRCPADSYYDPYSHRVHVRSYSMNSAVGTVWSGALGSGAALGSPVSGGWLPGIAYNAGQQQWLTYGKFSSIIRPSPANLYVIMDENSYSINDGSLITAAAASPGATYIIDNPGGNHDSATPISFADGHVIMRKWLDARTCANTGLEGMGSTASSHQSPDNPDCFFLAGITSAAR